MSDLFRYRFLSVICALCVLNFIVFWIVGIAIGGDAFSGKVVGTHFYLGSHCRFTEVSEAIYTYSLWHARSLLLTHPLFFLMGALALKQQKAMKRNAWTLAPPP